MKGTIEYKNGVLYVNFAAKTNLTVHTRMCEMGFVTTNRKRYLKTKGLRESEYDYLEGLVGHTGLGMAYIPAAEQGFILDTVVPDSMAFEMHMAVRKVKQKIGKSLFQYVCEKLDYSPADLVSSLAAEQVDGVALAIYNIEEKEQGIIIGDQTGIGKGRQAAAMIRYGIKQGLKPIFLSEKPNLFSDIYRDLVDIKSEQYVPFIINARDSKTHVKDKNGNIIHKAPETNEQSNILKSKKLPKGFDFICATYTQFNQPKKKPLKPDFLRELSKGNLIIMDEAHNSSGASNTGQFMQGILWHSKGVVFLSATYAKRPDNMPIYAGKTAIKDASLTNEGLVQAIVNGGVALQEVISSQLVLEGQLIRRERSFEGVEVNYMNLDKFGKEHEQRANKVTEIIRDIIEFQEVHIKPIIDDLDDIAVAAGKEVEGRKGTDKSGVDNPPYFSKVFNVINQMLFSLKAESVADHAVEMIKKGYKPVIAFSSTMGAFLEEMGKKDDVIEADFRSVLEKGLNGVLRYTTKDIDGNADHDVLDPNSLDPEAYDAYYAIKRKIEKASTGLLISPIDLVVQKIEKAGYSVGEVTGRKLALTYDKATLAGNTTNPKGMIRNRKKESTTDLFRGFNDNEIDCLLINQSGSTGASAHAVPTDKVPESEVKKRVMIILQAELDINTEIQKRGRINRTGQIYKPRYDYLISSIPAEQRLMMMLQKKLKSLDANTTSNQKSSENQLKTDDFLNKYGDVIVRQYLIENPKVTKTIGNPLRFTGSESDEKEQEGDAHIVSGRIAILPVTEQRRFYKEVIERYNDYLDYLIQADEYDLEVQTLKLEAETKDRRITKAGTGGNSAFGEDTYLEKCECNVLKKPFKKAELDKEIKSALNGRSADDIQSDILILQEEVSSKLLQEDLLHLEAKYDKMLKNVTEEPKYKKLDTPQQQEQYIEKRTEEINGARILDRDRITKEAKNRKDHMKRLISFFSIGKSINIPAKGFDMGIANVGGVSLGVMIDAKRKNPFAPSAVKVRIAIADSRKYLVLPLSGETGREVERIQSRSFSLSQYEQKEILENWDESIKSYNASRHNRYIFTGNLLQAATENGKLVSFTTKNGETRKGVLMPENWSPEQKGESANAYVIVPIKDAIPYVVSLRKGASIATQNGISIFRLQESYKIIIPKGQAHQTIFKDEELMELVDGDVGFTMVSGNMTGIVQDYYIAKFLKILSEKHRVSVKVGRQIFEDHIEPKRSRNYFDDDEYTQNAKEQLKADKKSFDERLKKQKQASGKKEDVNRKKKRLALRAKAIIILQKQAA